MKKKKKKILFICSFLPEISLMSYLNMKLIKKYSVSNEIFLLGTTYIRSGYKLSSDLKFVNVYEMFSEYKFIDKIEKMNEQDRYFKVGLYLDYYFEQYEFDEIIVDDFHIGVYIADKYGEKINELSTILFYDADANLLYREHYHNALDKVNKFKLIHFGLVNANFYQREFNYNFVWIDILEKSLLISDFDMNKNNILNIEDSDEKITDLIHNSIERFVQFDTNIILNTKLIVLDPQEKDEKKYSVAKTLLLLNIFGRVLVSRDNINKYQFEKVSRIQFNEDYILLFNRD